MNFWFTFSCDRRGSRRFVVRHTGGNVYRLPYEKKGRGLVRAGRTKAIADGQHLRQEREQQGILRLRLLDRLE